MSQIRFERVVKRLGGRVVLNGVSLEIKKGETFAIVGASGTGKSVSLKHMIRLLTPDEGQVWIGDDLISEARGADLERIRARFGVLFQGSALLQWLTVGQNVALPLIERLGIREGEALDRARKQLELLELEGAFDKMPADLSGGMQKRVGLARAIVTEPEILLYDEPTSGLDPVTSRTIDRLIEDLRKRLGVTSVMVTHDLHSALAIAHRIAVIDGGQIVETATPEEFVQSEQPVVRAFLEAQYITRSGTWEEGKPS
ncbi:MAG: ATP-binding cassette domain-containing protein [Kiritimatiellia bacterium]|nr:ATP-binding cassette domain-containing protein [Kiritimatiellia bacterium]